MTENGSGSGGERVREKGNGKGEEAGRERQGADQASGRLQAARRDFEAGDYRAVRELGREIEQSGDPEQERAARELIGRVQVDPAMVIALLVCAALFFGIAYVYVLR
jgi:hypothetical protein